MSKMMIKMLADMAGISPDEIATTITQFQNMATNGVALLESIDTRLNTVVTDVAAMKEQLNNLESVGDGV